GVARFRSGSVAEEILRRVSCPVLILPNDGPSRTPSERHPVLVPVDFSDHSASALETGGRLARLYGAPIEVVYVQDGLTRAALLAAWSLKAAAFVTDPPRAAPTREDLRAFAASAGLEDVTAHIDQGDPAERVVARAAALEAGAVVMGTHGRRGLSRALFGSVAEATLRRARCPVLTVRHVYKT
ncbi:universal stress protein, partial [Rubrivirga sp.]|uniref:universal stress protein n=1 Tax=Rubrivirga sp. TaxID=1885344 RepID=UPI003C759584